MAKGKDEKTKRKRLRKARTQGISDPSNSSDSEHDNATLAATLAATTANIEGGKPTSSPARGVDDDDNETEDSISSSHPVFSKPAPDITDPVKTDEAFEQLYLRRATEEFANDLDKLRSAGDFHGTKSVGLLVDALKQGVACFGPEERRRVVEAERK